MLPKAVSSILCDNVQRDAREKLYLLELFNVLSATAFPAEFRDTWLYCALTDGRGEVRLTFRPTDAADLYAKPVLATEVPLTFRGPLDVAEVVLSLALLRFPAPGVYVWQVERAGEVFHERRLLVQRVGG